MADSRLVIGDPVAPGLALASAISRKFPDLILPACDNSASLRENYERPTARGGKRPAVSKRFVPSIGSQRLVKLEEGGEATYLYEEGGRGIRGIEEEIGERR